MPEKISICGIEIENKENKKLSIILIYCPANIPITSQQWTSIMETIKPSGLLGRDFNAHHEAWGFLQK